MILFLELRRKQMKTRLQAVTSFSNSFKINKKKVGFLSRTVIFFLVVLSDLIAKDGLIQYIIIALGKKLENYGNIYYLVLRNQRRWRKKVSMGALTEVISSEICTSVQPKSLNKMYIWKAKQEIQFVDCCTFKFSHFLTLSWLTPIYQWLLIYFEQHPCSKILVLWSQRRSFLFNQL